MSSSAAEERILTLQASIDARLDAMRPQLEELVLRGQEKLELDRIRDARQAAFDTVDDQELQVFRSLQVRKGSLSINEMALRDKLWRKLTAGGKARERRERLLKSRKMW